MEVDASLFSEMEITKKRILRVINERISLQERCPTEIHERAMRLCIAFSGRRKSNVYFKIEIDHFGANMRSLLHRGLRSFRIE